jgi:hypothetical protein
MKYKIKNDFMFLTHKIEIINNNNLQNQFRTNITIKECTRFHHFMIIRVIFKDNNNN